MHFEYSYEENMSPRGLGVRHVLKEWDSVEHSWI